MNKIFYIFLILTFFLTSNLRAGEQSSVLLSGKVHYSIPSDWKIMDRKSDTSSDRIWLNIPSEKTEDAPEGITATLIAEINEDHLSVKQYSDLRRETLSREKNRSTGTMFVGDKTDKETWRTVFAKVVDSKYNKPFREPELVFDRFGVTSETKVHFRISLPILKNGDQEWIRICAQINDVVKELKIGNENTVESMLVYDKGYLGLKDLTISEPPSLQTLVK